MTTTPVNPRPFLAGLVGKDIVVKLKWGMEYKGCLDRADTYMNLQMTDVKEYVDGVQRTEIKELLIRCNNVLFVRLQNEGEDLATSVEEEQPMTAE